jgi:hypothetical protein
MTRVERRPSRFRNQEFATAILGENQGLLGHRAHRLLAEHGCEAASKAASGRLVQLCCREFVPQLAESTFDQLIVLCEALGQRAHP